MTHGGGAVRIEATGSVTVNGSILASAGGATSFWYFLYYTRYQTPGSGGSGGSEGGSEGGQSNSDTGTYTFTIIVSE